MELKEMIETYMMLLDNSIKNMEENLARSKRDIEYEASHDHRIGTIASYVENALVTETRLDTTKSIYMELKGFMHDAK